MKKLRGVLLFIATSWISIASSITLNLSDTPLFLTKTAAPLTMMIIERDHKLFTGAYNDVTDLNGDGVPELHYTPSIDYYGYFDSHKCYSYSSKNGEFDPTTVTATKKCSGAWSGDWLNWATMTRIDLLRKALYGGDRGNNDTPGQTILQRTILPQDGHSFGKEYTSAAVDGYNITDYTPLAQPTAGTRHLFANTTLMNNNDNKSYTVNQPLLRVVLNSSARIWDWIGKSKPIAGQVLASGATVNPTEYIVRIKVCDNSVGLESNCKLYADTASKSVKPTGLVQAFGENVTMKFGLFTGTFNNNIEGGVLRKNIEDLSNEISWNNGQFTSASIGLIQAINRLLIPDFQVDYSYKDGFVFNRPLNNSEFQSWGNPIAEIFHEALRYYAGKLTPTSAFTYTGGTDNSMALPKPKWFDPYDPSQNPACAKPNILIVSDPNPNYDSNMVPGSYFNSYSSDLTPTPNVSALADTIWNTEFGGSSKQAYIGQSGTNYDGTPSAKTVTSFSNIRGLIPDEPSKQGTYYTAALAYWAWQNDISAAPGDQNVHTYSLALGSPLPNIDINAGGKKITLVPFAKTVGKTSSSCINNTQIDATKGGFQPTNQMIGYYITALTPTSGTIRINFNDLEQGGNYDVTNTALYSYVVNADNTVSVTVTSTYSSDCLIKHIGYVVSGTTADGPYLVVRDATVPTDITYFLDTPGITRPMPLTDTRTFTPGNNPPATTLNNPLYLAAKWGSFNDINANNVPDLTDEWSTVTPGTPDNYFLVSNPLMMSQQLNSALENILARSSSAAAAAISSGSLNSSTRLYQVMFNTIDWSGEVLSFPIKSDGSLNVSGPGPNGAEWDAGDKITAQNYNTGRNIITYNPDSRTGIPFRWPVNPNSPASTELSPNEITSLNLNPDTGINDGLGSARLNYIRGLATNEKLNGGTFRNRPNSKLGDIVNSAPMYVGAPNLPYLDIWSDPTAPENSNPYSTYKSSHANRIPVLYVGANDGMLHAIHATAGTELLAFVPNSAYYYTSPSGSITSKLGLLTSPLYQHRYFVDGSPNVSDVFYNGQWHTVLVSGLNKGGQSIFALDVTDPSQFTETNANNLVLWTFNDFNTSPSGVQPNGDQDLGYTYSQPSIVRMRNGHWAAIFGNGYNNTELNSSGSATGDAVLYIVDIQTGTLIKKIDTGVGAANDPLVQSRPNGLATAAVVSINVDNIATYVYAGDLFGNLWKFDVSDPDPTKWGVAYNGQPFFVATDAAGKRQPITSRPIVGAPDGPVKILFGTGKFLEPNDKTDLSTQTFYGLTDDGSGPITGRNQLLQQTILAEVSSNGQSYRVTTNNYMTSSQRGWYMDLLQPPNATQQGERVISNPILRNGSVIFVTMIPSGDICSYGGTGWLMEINANTGARLAYSPFDVNGDSHFTSADFISFVDQNGNTQTVPPSGVGSQVGIIPAPGILSSNLGQIEYKYTPGSSGEIGVNVENPGTANTGRQSWKQVR